MTVTRNLLAVTLTAWLVAACYGDQSWQVGVRNDTDRAFTLLLTFEEGFSYSTTVPARSSGFANSGSGDPPDRYTLRDDSCATVFQGELADDDVIGLSITVDGVSVEARPAWTVPSTNFRPATRCIAS